MATRWLIEDPAGADTYSFSINPAEGGSPVYEKNITEESTAAPNGKTLLFEGLDSPQKLEFSGTILEEAQYNAFVSWFQKRRQVKLTDDLGRVYWVYITSFKPKRERAVHYPCKHSYDMTCTILSWT
jgi:hypothetical protein